MGKTGATSQSGPSGLTAIPSGLPIIPGTIGPLGQSLRAFESCPNTFDPTVAPGLDRPIGARLSRRNGLAAWDKVGPNATDWAPFNGSTGNAGMVLKFSGLLASGISGVNHDLADSGSLPTVNVSGAATGVQYCPPACTIEFLRVFLAANGNADTTVVTLQKNGIDTTLTLTVPASGTGIFNATDPGIDFNGTTDLLSVIVFQTGGEPAGDTNITAILSGSAAFVPTPVPPPPFDPTSIAGCVLWLRGDLGVTDSGGACSAWADQSGAGNDCGQADPSKRPTINPASINGQAGLTFPPDARCFLTGPNNLMASGSPRSIFVAINPAANPADGIDGGLLFSFRRDTTPFTLAWLHFLGPDLSLYYADNLGNSGLGTPQITPGVDVIGEMYGTGAVVSAKVSATPIVLTFDTQAAEAGAAGYDIATCQASAATFNFSGEIAEIIVYDNVIAPADQAAVYAYLAARYSI